MQAPATKSRSLNQGMPLHAAMGEEVHACKLAFIMMELVSLTAHATVYSAKGKNVHFWEGAGLASQRDCAISGQSR